MTTGSATQASSSEDVLKAFEAIPRLAAGDSDLERRGRFLSCTMEIGVGPIPLALVIERGRAGSIARGPFLLRSFDFSIRAEPETWRRFLEPVPAPGWHDVFALSKVGRARFEGNLVPLMGNLQYVKDLIALPRTLAGEKAAR